MLKHFLVPDDIAVRVKPELQMWQDGLGIKVRDGGHEILPTGGHETARRWPSKLPIGGH